MAVAWRNFVRGHPALHVGVAATAAGHALASGCRRAALGILITLSGLGFASR